MTRDNIEANSIYFNTSKRAFTTASDLLERLSDPTNESAQKASERAVSTMQTGRTYLSVAVILSMVTAGMILLYVIRTIALPLKEVAARKNALSSGEIDIAIPNKGRQDELGEIANAVSVSGDNDIELKPSQRRLALQATMLEEKLAQEMRLNELQRNFVSTASHEFRTPMTIIDGHAQRLMNMRSDW